MSDTATRQAELSKRMDGLRSDFHEELKLAHLELRNIACVLSNPPDELDQGIFDRLQNIAHRLAGSAGVFGFGAVGDEGTALETVIRDLQAGLPEIAGACERLVEVIGEGLLEQAAAPADGESPIIEVRAKPSRITYVEDEADIREIGEIALGSIGGFEVDVCQDGYEAVARAPDFGPDMIILDVMMPGIDGVETYKRLRFDPTLKHVPIIFMTARVQDDEIAEYRALGCTDVITKPFDPIELPNRIEKIWQQANARRAA